jgi:catechol 2,3-dioxygenase-like lactoylglutathione lyase family enzyme
MMFDHVGIRVSDIGRSAAFYDAVLKPLGFVRCVSYEGGAGYGPEGQPSFWLSLSAAGGAHIAFAAESGASVDAFHLAGLEAGGRDNGAPGLRPDYGPNYYAAFLVDPDGNNIEAVHMAGGAG